MMRNGIYVKFEIFPSAIILILILMKVIKEAVLSIILLFIFFLNKCDNKSACYQVMELRQ